MIIIAFSVFLAMARAQSNECGALLDLAITSAKAGIRMSREALAAGDFKREIKPDGSLVTAADLAVSRQLVKMLGEGSGLPVFSEENEPPPVDELMAWPRFWVIDPIDGTENFAKDGKDFSVLIALVERDANGVARPIVGVTGRPAENKIYFGAIDKGSWVIDLGRARDAGVRLFGPDNPAGRPRATMQKGTQALLEASRLKDELVFDRVGGNGAKYLAMAENRVDCYFAQPMKWWDIAAGDALYRYGVADGRAPRSSPLEYIPHEGSKLFYQERGFILGESCLNADARGEILAILNRKR